MSVLWVYLTLTMHHLHPLYAEVPGVHCIHRRNVLAEELIHGLALAVVLLTSISGGGLRKQLALIEQ